MQSAHNVNSEIMQTDRMTTIRSTRVARLTGLTRVTKLHGITQLAEWSYCEQSWKVGFLIKADALNRLHLPFVYKCCSWCSREKATALVVILRCVWPLWDSPTESFRSRVVSIFQKYFTGDTLPLACFWREEGMRRFYYIITLILPKGKGTTKVA